MLKHVFFSVSVLIILNVPGLAASSQDLMDLNPETNSTLQSIHGEQQSIQMKLLAVQSTVEAQRITMLNSLKNIITNEDLGAKLNETERQLKNLLHLLETKLDALLESKENFEKRFNDTEAQLQTVLSMVPKKESNPLEAPSTNYSKHIPLQYEKIGTRYFYIEKNLTKNWFEAAATCHQMGGYLAGIKTLKELFAIQLELEDNTWYWLGINDLMTAGQFLSVASGKPANTLNWYSQHPKNDRKCVQLRNGLMIDYSCTDNINFICQADSET
nr:accessory gland protein Acp29AB-like [Drosophila takahashii]